MMSESTTAQLQAALEKVLNDFTVDDSAPHPAEVQLAIQLARRLQQRAADLQTPQERRQQAELDKMIRNPGDKVTLMQMTDEAFRSRAPQRAAEQLIHILDVQGIPRFFSTMERAMLRGFQSFGGYLPGVAMPLVREKMQQETANVILPAETELLGRHLRDRRAENLRMNVNYLGEALLGEREAERRLQDYLAALQRPEIEVVSVKISTIYSQISALARKHTVEKLCNRMELLYRAAAKATFQRSDGTVVPKFVYLDMEEYRDKELTAEVFMSTLDRPGLEQVQAGIALQAYIPDSFETQQQVNVWARQRVANGGAPITIRLVKGANMEMERVEATMRDWPQAPYRTKMETDANYKRMLETGMQPENLAATRLGIASHNLFTLAYGIVLATRAKALGQVQFEMLEGMANHQRRALFELSQNVLLYAPACRQEDFISAIGYLVRRLDENTGEDNFLRHAFNITVDSPTWKRLEQHFRDSSAAIPGLNQRPRRRQDRSQPYKVDRIPAAWQQFANEPDTDWSLRQNGEWAEGIVSSWYLRCDAEASEVGLVIAGEDIGSNRKEVESTDPSRPGVVTARYLQASEEDIERAVLCADEDPDGWRATSVAERCRALYRVADNIAQRRGDLMGAMLAEGGKTLAESDPEVSEAIDFCRFYADSARSLHDIGGFTAHGRGVVVVVSPWNFPLAIPCGGVAAALAAGNNVILKPASDTVMIAFQLCQCFWDAGVPKTALQFAPCSGRTVGQQLVTPRCGRHRHSDRRYLDGSADACRKAVHPIDGRNGRQERDHRHGTRGSRSIHQEHLAQCI